MHAVLWLTKQCPNHRVPLRLTIVKACFHMIAELFAICDPIEKFKARCINEEEILHQPSLDPELLSKHAIFTSLFPHLAQITQVFIFPSLHL